MLISFSKTNSSFATFPLFLKFLTLLIKSVSSISAPNKFKVCCFRISVRYTQFLIQNFHPLLVIGTPVTELF